MFFWDSYKDYISKKRFQLFCFLKKFIDIFWMSVLQKPLRYRQSATNTFLLISSQMRRVKVKGNFLTQEHYSSLYYVSMPVLITIELRANQQDRSNVCNPLSNYRISRKEKYVVNVQYKQTWTKNRPWQYSSNNFVKGL